MEKTQLDAACSTDRVSKRQRYTRNACNQCKLRKVKCSGELHCQNCSRSSINCTYARPPHLGGRGLSAPSRKLEGKLEKLRSHSDRVLEQIKASDQHDDVSIQITLREIAAQINTCTTKIQSPLEGDTAGYCQPAQVVTAWSSADILHIPLQDPLELSPPSSMSFALTSPQSSNKQNCLDPLLRVSSRRAFQLIDKFRDEADSLYPFIPIDSLTSLASILLDPSSARPGFELQRQRHTENWDDMFDSRNLDLLRVLLACALASENNKENDLSHQLMSGASERLSDKTRGASPDLKDIAVATLLSVYFLQCDDLNLAWRKIGNAAKMCLEIGLHKANSTDVAWAPSMFWSIYVLDRRFSFMINLPYTLHDHDFDRPPPQFDVKSPYLLPLVEYVRIGARVLHGLPTFNSPSDPVDATTCASLEHEIDEWALKTTTRLTTAQEQLEPQERPNLFRFRKTNFNRAFVSVCQNQLKISLYKHAVFCARNTYGNPHFCQKAVSYSIDTIDVCSRLRRTSDVYEAYAVHFNLLVLSAVAVLYLAVRHAPQQLGCATQGLLRGFEILKASCVSGAASGRLVERVRALENVIMPLESIPLVRKETNFVQLDTRNQYVPRRAESWGFGDGNGEHEMVPSDWIAEFELSPMHIWADLPELDHSFSNEV